MDARPGVRAVEQANKALNECMSVYPFLKFYVVFRVFGNRVHGVVTGLNVLSMVRSGRKIVNSPTAIVFDNRPQN